jgi:type IV pilus assembly protein PilQ
MIGTVELLAFAVAVGLAGAAPASGESLISLQAKDADVRDVVSLLAEAGGVQVVFDPGVACRLTLAFEAAQLESALGSVLRACGLAVEQEGNVLRVARLERLREEARQRRALREEQDVGRPRRLQLERLSYARARELAPLLQQQLPPGAEVTFDERTNTLIVIN